MNMHDSGHPQLQTKAKAKAYRFLVTRKEVVFYKGLIPRLLTVRCRTATIDA